MHIFCDARAKHEKKIEYQIEVRKISWVVLQISEL